jgi:hypothetical protein
MMTFYFVSLPKIRTPLLYDAFRREHRLEREYVCIHIGGMQERALRA